MTSAGASEASQLTRAGADALRRGRPGEAKEIFLAVLRARAGDVSARIGLALACRDLGDGQGHLAAIDLVLAANPGHLPALLMKADHFAKLGDGRAAQSFYRAVVDRAPALDTLPPDLRQEVRRAERESTQYVRTYETHLSEAVSRAGFDRSTSSRRFAQSLDLMLGVKQIYFQSPTAFFFAELPQRQFYERSEFPWLPALEAESDVIREELARVLGDGAGLEPYIRRDGSRPPKDFGLLLENPAWSAFYLIRNGADVAEAVASCPRTMAALNKVPLCRSPGRTPSVLFSILRPGTRIPPHTGYTNARLICHLPLIVPEGCGLRVGNETRHWTPSEALVFDDSIEHEAWNESRQMRAVLLFDIWRPELSLEEQTLVAATLSAVGSYDGAAPP